VSVDQVSHVASGDDSGSPLGIYGINAATRLNSGLVESRRYHGLRQQFTLQAVSGRLIPWHPVSHCLRWSVPGASSVELHYLPEYKRGKLRRLQTCKSVWACPVCASIITEKRRQKLAQAVAEARRRGWQVFMVTLTFEHDRADDLGQITDKMVEAWRRLTSHRGYKALRAVAGIEGYIRALEVTHSYRNAWHPHMHLLVFSSGGISAAQFEDKLGPMWLGALQLVGLTCHVRIGCHVDDTNARVADYVQKYGREPIWDESAEVTKAHIKTGRFESRTPFQLLADAAGGDRAAGFLFAEFNKVFRGRRQLFASHGIWRELLGEEMAEDAELVEEADTVSTLLGLLRFEGWRIVLAQDARAELVTALDTGDLGQVASLLDHLGISPDMLVPIGG
jgi:hypothetical protein